MKLAIHGLGRIGRVAVRQVLSHPDLELAMACDLMEPRVAAHLVRFDSVHGEAPFPVAWEPEALVLRGHRIPYTQEPDPTRLHLDGLDAVLTCTGRHRTSEALAPFLARGIRVIQAGSAQDLAPSVPGLAGTLPAPRMATGDAALAPLSLLCSVLEEAFGLEAVLATSVRGYTGDQKILDLPHAGTSATRLRLARAAHASMIPFPAPVLSTELTALMPGLAGRIQAMEVRVPTPNAAMVEVNATLKSDATTAAIADAFTRAAQGTLRGHMVVLQEERVSADLTGHPACAFDPFLTRVLAPRMVKVLAWHDPEWGCAARMLDLAICGRHA